MERPIAVIEICSKCIKLVVGYVIDGQVQVIYTTSRNTGLIMENGRIVDENALLNGLHSLNFIEDSQAKLKITISEIILVIPPLGLTVYQTKQSTNLVSEGDKVGELDIRNLYSLVMKSQVGLNNSLVDAIPRVFILDGARNFDYIPLGQVSSSISAVIRLHSLPTNIYLSYRNAALDGGFVVKRSMIAPQGAVTLLSSYEETPRDYFLVDIGSNVTTVSLIGQKELYDSRFFAWGGDSITEKIIATFNINEADAEKYKILYGYDTREYTFKPVVCTSLDAFGHKVEHTVDDLNAVIKGELDSLVAQINSCIKSLLESYPNQASQYEKIPLVLVGGGSLLGGMIHYIEPKLPNDKVVLGTNKVLGARYMGLVNALGAILCQHRYPALGDDNQQRVISLSREAK